MRKPAWQPRTRLATAMACTVAVLSMVSCARDSPAGEPFALTGEGTTDASWPFWARSMRIHPLSRMTDDPRDPSQVLVETRIEFTDAWEDPCKAVGLLTIDLLDGADPNRYILDKDRYEADLRDLDINIERWDPVTRTYVLKLEVSRLRIPVRPQLVAVFESVDGGRAEDRANVRPYRQESAATRQPGSVLP